MRRGEGGRVSRQPRERKRVENPPRSRRSLGREKQKAPDDGRIARWHLSIQCAAVCGAKASPAHGKTPKARSGRVRGPRRGVALDPRANPRAGGASRAARAERAADARSARARSLRAGRVSVPHSPRSRKRKGTSSRGFSSNARVANPNRVAPERARGARAGTMQPGIAPGASERRPDTTSRGKIGRDTASWDVREGRTCTTSRPPAQHDATASSVGMQNKLVSSPLPPRVWLGQGAKYDARIMGGTHASSAGKPAASCAGTEGGRGGVEGSARGVGEGVGFDRKARCRSRTRSTR